MFESFFYNFIEKIEEYIISPDFSSLTKEEALLFNSILESITDLYKKFEVNNKILNEDELLNSKWLEQHGKQLLTLYFDKNTLSFIGKKFPDILKNNIFCLFHLMPEGEIELNMLNRFIINLKCLRIYILSLLAVIEEVSSKFIHGF